MRFLRVQSSRVLRENLSKVKYKILHLASLTLKKEPRCVVGFFMYWGQHIPYLRMLLQPKSQVTWKALSLSEA